jgi:hypothetical protein
MYTDGAVLRRMLNQRLGTLISGGSRQGSVYITSSVEEFFEEHFLQSQRRTRL